MKSKAVFFLFFVLAANIFAVSPTTKNVNKAKRYYATLERLAENFDGDFSDEEGFFIMGRMIHFVEVLKPVFDDFYDEGITEISLYDVEELSSAHEQIFEYKPLIEMFFYNIDALLVQAIREDSDLPSKFRNMPDEKLLDLPLLEFVEPFSDFDFDEVRKYFPGMSYDEIMSMTLRDIFEVLLFSEAFELEVGFDFKKCKAAYEKGLAYDKIEFD